MFHFSDVMVPRISTYVIPTSCRSTSTNQLLLVPFSRMHVKIFCLRSTFVNVFWFVQCEFRIRSDIISAPVLSSWLCRRLPYPSGPTFYLESFFFSLPVSPQGTPQRARCPVARLYGSARAWQLRITISCCASSRLYYFCYKSACFEVSQSVTRIYSKNV